MANVALIPRSRGGVSGLALILLGAWGGIAPYAGPVFGYGYTPDQAWQYTKGRLFLSAVPGALTLIAGLGVMLTRRRGFGGCCAVIAALGGAWFIVGAWAVQMLPASVGRSIVVGQPIATTTARIALTNIGFFFGVGALIVFFAALALGRFSVAAAKDQERLSSFLTTAASGAPGSGTGTGFASTQPQYVPDQYAYSPDPFAPQYPPEGYPPDPYTPGGAAPADPGIDSAQTQTQFPRGSAGT